jgi:hypothetical protein
LIKNLPKIKTMYSYALMEQILSSAFNFIMVFLISSFDSQFLQSYGIAYTLYLVISGQIRNSLFNQFLINGNYKIGYFIHLSKYSLLNWYFVSVFTACFIYSCIYIDLSIFFLVLIIYTVIDFVRSYLFSNNKSKINFWINLTIYMAISIVVILRGVRDSLIVAFCIIAFAVFVLYYFRLFEIEEFIENSTSELSVNNKESFILSTTYSVYTHLPLVFINIIAPLAVPLLIQVRAVFQASQIISRFVDMIEKKSSSGSNVNDLSGQVVKRVFMSGLIGLLLNVAILATGLYVFSTILSVPIEFDVIISFMYYFAISSVIFFVKPIETFFMKLGKLNVIANSRLLTAGVFSVMSSIVILMAGNYTYILLVSFLSWALVLIIGLYHLREFRSFKNEGGF